MGALGAERLSPSRNSRARRRNVLSGRATTPPTTWTGAGRNGSTSPTSSPRPSRSRCVRQTPGLGVPEEGASLSRGRGCSRRREEQGRRSPSPGMAGPADRRGRQGPPPQEGISGHGCGARRAGAGRLPTGGRGRGGSVAGVSDRQPSGGRGLGNLAFRPTGSAVQPARDCLGGNRCALGAKAPASGRRRVRGDRRGSRLTVRTNWRGGKKKGSGPKAAPDPFNNGGLLD